MASRSASGSTRRQLCTSSKMLMFPLEVQLCTWVSTMITTKQTSAPKRATMRCRLSTHHLPIQKMSSRLISQQVSKSQLLRSHLTSNSMPPSYNNKNWSGRSVPIKAGHSSCRAVAHGSTWSRYTKSRCKTCQSSFVANSRTRTPSPTSTSATQSSECTERSLKHT